MATIYSFYKSNIPLEIVRAQKSVFDHFGIPLRQEIDDSLSHAEWLWQTFDKSDSDVVVVADIDAFPLNRGAFDLMVDKASEGRLVGLAQVANHRDPSKIYAGPMFLAMTKKLFRQFGNPNLSDDGKLDVAQVLTEEAYKAGVPVELVFPRFAVQPKWALSDKGLFGIGTFYGDLEFFHMFQVRHNRAVELFSKVADDTINGRFQFDSYLDIYRKTPSQNRITRSLRRVARRVLRSGFD